tara:strand:- start:135 stop:401 length:267 start_codon:yes stop_codon:yes gene_type:complete
MYINIKHNIDWWEGGIEIDEIIRKFCERLCMKEGNYSKYTPCYSYLQYEDTNMKQFNSLKRKLNSSKRLKKSRKGVDVVIKCEANNVC